MLNKFEEELKNLNSNFAEDVQKIKAEKEVLR